METVMTGLCLQQQWTLEIYEAVILARRETTYVGSNLNDIYVGTVFHVSAVFQVLPDSKQMQINTYLGRYQEKNEYCVVEHHWPLVTKY